ncbi:MAG: EMC3/TMCO1 family protein [Nanoarchaeota archaeon]|nr:EMC3/TMCO1 family protein [Nanoarchaeota archaeon]
MSFLDPVLNPLLALPIFTLVVLMSFLITLLITLIYKFTTNQSLMKSLKSELKELQKEMKELRDHPEKMMKVQKQAMQTNMKYMGQSMKSTLYTFLPIILIFGWMNAHLAFIPITPGSEFTTTVFFEDNVRGAATIDVSPELEVIGPINKTIEGNKIIWTLKGSSGEHLIQYRAGQKTYEKDVLISDSPEYATNIEKVKDGIVKQITIDHEKREFDLKIFKLGWLGTYILFSIVFSMILRKLFKVY